MSTIENDTKKRKYSIGNNSYVASSGGGSTNAECLVSPNGTDMLCATNTGLKSTTTDTVHEIDIIDSAGIVTSDFLYQKGRMNVVFTGSDFGSDFDVRSGVNMNTSSPSSAIANLRASAVTGGSTVLNIVSATPFGANMSATNSAIPNDNTLFQALSTSALMRHGVSTGAGGAGICTVTCDSPVLSLNSTPVTGKEAAIDLDHSALNGVTIMHGLASAPTSSTITLQKGENVQRIVKNTTTIPNDGIVEGINRKHRFMRNFTSSTAEGIEEYYEDVKTFSSLTNFFIFPLTPDISYTITDLVIQQTTTVGGTVTSAPSAQASWKLDTPFTFVINTPLLPGPVGGPWTSYTNTQNGGVLGTLAAPTIEYTISALRINVTPLRDSGGFDLSTKANLYCKLLKFPAL
jgi:hypothetical protein